MKLRKQIILASTVSLLALGFSCKRANNGPDLASASENFSFTEGLSTDNPSLNFEIDQYISFNAKFSENVSWELNIKGLSSNAVKTFKGTGQEIKADETIWDGASSNVYFFRANEQAVAELQITGLEESFYSDTLLVQDPKFYHNVTYNGIRHLVIDDFEKNESTSIDDMTLGRSPDQADIDVNFGRNQNIVVQGEYSYNMSGNDINRNSWSGDLTSETLLELAQSEITKIDSGISPEDLYFNLFIYGQGSSSSGVQIRLYEIDGKQGTATDSIKNVQELIEFASNEVNTFDVTQNDAWIKNINVNWEGWKMVSVPYSEFEANQDPASGGNGDRKKESWRITGASLSLLSLPEGNFNEVYLDMFVVTQGGRFQR